MQNEHTLNWLMDLVANAKSENTDEAKKNVVSSVPTSLVESLMHDAASSESSKNGSTCKKKHIFRIDNGRLGGV